MKTNNWHLNRAKTSRVIAVAQEWSIYLLLATMLATGLYYGLHLN